jgi:hypothetical protein
MLGQVPVRSWIGVQVNYNQINLLAPNWKPASNKIQVNSVLNEV